MLLECDPLLLGLTPSELRQVTILRRRPGHIVYRVVCESASYVLKCFHDPAAGIELQTYALLENCGVPTLPVYARTHRALLLEDLDHSPVWRPARDADMDRPSTGLAVARWYHRLHQAGRELLADPETRPAFLPAWVDAIDDRSLRAAGAALNLGDEPGWPLALQCAEPIKSAYRARPQTLNYNDFAPENLALPREEKDPPGAIVFDYDQFSLGLSCSDWRNVRSGLRGLARAAFEEAFGPVSPVERILDRPLSVLYGLVIASRRDRFPGWAVPLLKLVKTGELERRIRHALQFA